MSSSIEGISGRLRRGTNSGDPEKVATNVIQGGGREVNPGER